MGILQTAGWAAYYIAYTLLFYFGKMYKESFEMRSFLLFSLTYVFAFFSTIGMRCVYRYYYNKIEKLILLPVIILAASFIGSALMHFVDLYVSHYFWGEEGALILKKRLSIKYF